jgi:hypothetical protein
MFDRYTYAAGYTEKLHAELSLIDMLEESEISLGEKPMIETYKQSNRAAPFFKITLQS